jgi:hypothetical protein
MQEHNIVASRFFQFGVVFSLSILIASALGKGDQLVFVGILGMAALVCSFLWYEIFSLPVLLACFFWTGMRLPFSGFAETVRWVILGLAAIAGLIFWVKQNGDFRLGPLHILASLTMLTFLMSCSVSPNPSLTLLKSSSIGLLFLYAASGALIFISRREATFFRGASLTCEAMTYASGICYGLLGFPIYGNPNSLGAVMGVLVWPILFWDLLTTKAKIQWRRKFFALLCCGWLLQYSLARAGFLAALVSSLFILFTLNRKRLMISFGLSALIGVFVLAAFMPDRWQTLVQGTVYKNKPGTQILDSRRPRWEETIDEIKSSPWLGNGFGASRDLSEEWKGGMASQSFNRERGSSYLTLIAGVGFAGFIPAIGLLLFLIKRIVQASRRIRLSGSFLDPSIPMAGVLLAAMCHVFFEDWLFAVGYYMSVVFWIFAFALNHRENAAQTAHIPIG